MRIALYGLPCAGKTTILSTLSDVRVVNGSAELNKMSNGSFNSLSDKEKNHLRVEYIRFLMNLTDEVVLSDGHYAFLDNVVFTEDDAKAYDVFIYLFCPPETLLNRYACSEKNQKYAELSISRIERWQSFEIERLRYECHRNDKDFYVINGDTVSPCDFASFIEKIKGGYSSYGLAAETVQKIRNAYPDPCSLNLVDGDKTLIIQDSFRVCSNGYLTKTFDGDFYTGYQSLVFDAEVKNIVFDYTRLNRIEVNEQVYSRIQHAPYFVISAGITELWDALSKIYGFKNVIASPLISADTKFFIVKLLKLAGYSVIAYGDSKNDLYMLHEADEGYLCTAQKLSKSLRGADTRKLHLIYDKREVVLNSICAAEILDEVAVCKSNSGINGNRLATAHFSLGKRIGEEIAKVIPSDDSAVLVLERGGRFFGDGVYMTFGGRFFPYNPSKDSFPSIDASVIVIVDSVINTGRSLIEVIQRIKVSNPSAEIIIATNVIQEKAVPLLQDYKVFAVRVSSNSFTGKNQATQIGKTGPDTADRLFNLIRQQ
jgi:shikimate kinase